MTKNFQFSIFNFQFRKGFTLVELLIYMGLLSIFLIVMTDLLVQILDLRSTSTATSIVTADAQYLRDRLSYDIRRATAITTPSAPGASSSQLQLDIGGSTSVYTVSNDALVLTTGGSTDALTTSSASISGFLVTRVGNGTGDDDLQIQFTLASTTIVRTKQAESEDFSFTIGTR